MPPFGLDDILSQYTYSADDYCDTDSVQEQDGDLEEKVLTYFDSAKKQMETAYAQQLLRKVLPSNMNIIFGSMFGSHNGDAIEDIVYQCKLIYQYITSNPNTSHVFNRMFKLVVTLKFFECLSFAEKLES